LARFFLLFYKVLYITWNETHRQCRLFKRQIIKSKSGVDFGSWVLPQGKEWIKPRVFSSVFEICVASNRQAAFLKLFQKNLTN